MSLKTFTYLDEFVVVLCQNRVKVMGFFSRKHQLETWVRVKVRKVIFPYYLINQKTLTEENVSLKKIS